MRTLHRIGFGVLCLFTLLAAPFTSLAQIFSFAADTNPPVVLSAVASCDGLTIVVTYSEPVDRDAASDIFNYIVQDGQGNESFVIAAALFDSQTVHLLLFRPLSSENSNTLALVFCIPDLAGNCLYGQTAPIEFDTTPPVVTCSVATSTLFPVNNALVDVGLTAATDFSSPVQVQVYSDEPALGDATYQNGLLKLRARRNPAGDGRVYLIVVTSTDACGNVGVCCTTVVVPHNGSAAALNSVQAQAVAAQGQCSPSGSPSTPNLILP